MRFRERSEQEIVTPCDPWKLISKNMKKNTQLFTAVVMCSFGGSLLVAGFVIPPMGEIHHSVLIAFGEILTFSGSLIGIDYKYRYKE